MAGTSRTARHADTISRRTLLRTTGVVGGAALLAGCTFPGGTPTASSAGRKDAVLGVDEPVGLNPITASGDGPGLRVMRNSIYDTLVGWDWANGRPVPGLALSWKQEDSLNWTLKLREGVQFHKGYGEMTSADVEWLFNYIIGENKAEKFRFNGVKGATATSKYEVRVTLSQPFAPFITVTGWGGGMVPSKKAYEEIGEQAFVRNPVSTGPFEFSSWEPGSRIVLKRFDKHWNADRPKLDQVTFKFLTDPSVRTAQLNTGEVDFIHVTSFNQVDSLSQTKGIRVESVAGGYYDYVASLVTKPPFNKREVRQAISYAIDRTALAKAVYFGHAKIDDQPLIPGYLGYEDKHYFPLTSDVTRAKDLLAQAGLSNGFKTTLLVTTDATQQRIATIVADQLKQVGITAQITPLDLAAYNAKAGVGDWEMGISSINIAAPDTDAALYIFYRTGAATGGTKTFFSDPQVDQLLDAARAETQLDKRADLYKQVLARVVPEAVYMYLNHANVVYAMNEKLVGFTPVSSPNVYHNIADMHWEQ